MSSEINLIISSKGNQPILNNIFHNEPTSVKINNILNDSCKRECFFQNDLNNVTLIFDYEITTTANMFAGLTNIIEVDLSNFNSSKVTNMNSMFKGCSNLRHINFGKIDTSSVTNMDSLFKSCYELTSIDLSNFDTSSVSDMDYMFSNCQKIISIDASSFDTSSVINMQDLFAYCFELISVNVSSFITSKVKVMRGLFFKCYKLKYLDLQNFDTTSIATLLSAFGYCQSLMYLNLKKFEIQNTNSVNASFIFDDIPSYTKFCIQDINTKNFLIGNKSSDCSDICFDNNSMFDYDQNKCFCNENNKFEYNGKCYKECPSNLFHILQDKYICSDIIPENYYLDINDNIYKKCYDTCQNCSKSGNETNHNCDNCITNYIFLDELLIPTNNCYNKCDSYYYITDNNQYYCTDICPSQYNNIVLQKSKCIDECKKENKYIYKYKNYCLEECPNDTKIYEKEMECLDSCYDYLFEYNNTCYNNCPNNTYKIFQNRNICIDVIPENYYLDKNDNIYKECFNKCKKCNQPGNKTNHNCEQCIDQYIFIYNDSSVPPKNCYEKCNFYYFFNENGEYICTQYNYCPPEYKNLISNKYKCIDDCKKDDEYIYEYNNICLNKCPENTKISIADKKCLLLCNSNQFEADNICYNNFKNDTQNLFQNGNIFINNNSNFYDLLYNIILQSYEPKEGKLLTIQRNDDIIYQITNSKNELELLKNLSNNINNISIIDLGQCESILRETYHIDENDAFIFIKNEKKSNKSCEKNIKFDVYDPYNKTKLNLSICNKTSINLLVPTELSQETKQLYEKMKEEGYDMFNINDPFYQDICTPFGTSNGTDILLSDRIDYIYNNDDTQCQSNCKFSYYSIESKYMNCSCSVNENIDNNNDNKNEKFNAKKIYESFYDVLKYSNYGIIKCVNVIINKNIVIKNIGSLIVISYFFVYFICFIFFIIKGINPLKSKLKINIEKLEGKNNFDIKSKNKLLFPPTKKIKVQKLNKRSNPKKSASIYNKKINKFNLSKKMKINDIIQIFDKSSSRKKIANISQNNKKIDLKMNKINKSNIINKKEKRQIIEYDDYELNELEYIEAIKYDKRSLFQIFWATLKREHLIIFTFINCNDYNLLTIKLSRFIFLIVGDMALNVFFFSDDSMHKLFLNYGKYDFIQQIPQIVYSTIISQLIEVFLCFLSLTDKYVYQIKSILKTGYKNKILKIISCINIKLYIFFAFTFLFFIFYWYIISVFCGVYRNTQIHFIKDSIISFSICLVYPFVLYFISSSLRVLSLRDSKKRCKYIYSLSDMIPFF